MDKFVTACIALLLMAFPVTGLMYGLAHRYPGAMAEDWILLVCAVLSSFFLGTIVSFSFMTRLQK